MAKSAEDVRAAALEVPSITWEEFEPDFIAAWKELSGDYGGEHVTLIGPPGQGKTTLALRILNARADARETNEVICATKPRDPVLRRSGWPIVRQWPPGYGKDQVILWPPYGDPRTAAKRQRAVFQPMLAEAFKDGYRVLYIDEITYFEDELGLGKLLNTLLGQGRSQPIAMVGGTQRPARIGRAWFSHTSWLFLWKNQDEDDLRRIGEIGGTDTRLVRELVRSLAEHEVLVVRVRTGEMVRTTAPSAAR